ncbi:YihY family inner membrane protein [Ferriphaselus sp. R-1]|uniref:YihY family inner membrane protein n=1 Tax=Ferriphaselus sp. R-1 TaxID=1485544 RepID=UPI0006921D02|nr:YihY family inner membrane protein [Ferriphaselus sp. R-1]
MPSLIHRRLHDFRQFSLLLAQRFAQDRCNQIAASLTFTTLLSLVPLIAIALTLFSAFPVFADFSSSIKQFVLSNLMPETGGKLITRYMEQFAESATRLTTIGVLFLGAAAMLLMHTIEDAFNVIWRVSRPRALTQRVLIYWAVVTLGPLLVGGSLSATSWLVSLSSGYAKQVPFFGVGVLKIVPVLLTTLAYTLLFLVVPNRHVKLRHAFIGGVVSSVAFESMSRVFAAYITSFPTYKLVYGTFASIPIFLLWVYFSWLTTLMGALITSVLPHWRSKAAGPLTPATQLYHALRVLRVMSEGMKSGTIQTLPSLCGRLHVSFEGLEHLLDVLVKAGMVRKLAANGWVMIRDAEHIRASELYTRFVYTVPNLPAADEDVAILDWMTRTATLLQAQTDLTLKELFAGMHHD